MQRAVFLDRDDTLLVDSGYMSDADALELIPGARETLQRLRRAGLKLVLISNQSGVARGLVTQAQIRAIEERLYELLGHRLDGVEYCFHHPDEACPCRKPEPGMLRRAARRLDIDLSRSVMVGDQESDVEAGNAAGCWTVRIGPAPASSAADCLAPDLTGAADWILALGDRPKATASAARR
jgi:D-glycero-D-manno-heptose 1,7-bisphosphate phosphatase